MQNETQGSDLESAQVLRLRRAGAAGKATEPLNSSLGRLNDNSLPTPMAVWQSFTVELQSGELFYHLGATLLRVLAAFTVAMVIGSAIGICLGINQTANQIVDPWIILLLNVPALVIIVLSYIWFGLNEAAAIGAVALNKIPNVAVTLREGAKSLSPEYAEMAVVYRFGVMKRLRHVILPQLQPFFAAVEYLVLQPLDRQANRWRGRPA
jgi:NitT/TauT family transport system permease protein